MFDQIAIYLDSFIPETWDSFVYPLLLAFTLYMFNYTINEFNKEKKVLKKQLDLSIKQARYASKQRDELRTTVDDLTNIIQLMILEKHHGEGTRECKSEACRAELKIYGLDNRPLPWGIRLGDTEYKLGEAPETSNFQSSGKK